jgi:rfaE bifunctional protein nucleotidyltransferase chain/domain/rfaE bifunctional protein kinase chain/domain
VTVVGDTLLDVDWTGVVERVCPDAPAPVVDQRAEHARPGGAGLAALSAAACGASVTLVTALGADAEGDLVRSLLDAAGVSLIDLGLAGPTPVKLRVRSGGQSLVRVDRGCSPVVPPGPWCDAAGEAVLCSHAVLVSDYGRGLVAAGPFARLVPALAQPVVWDPHARGARPPRGLDLLVPNRDEAARLDDAVEDDRPGPGGVEDADGLLAGRLARRFGCTVALTRGSHGVVVAGPDGQMFLVPVEPAAGDPCGAGDRFAAAAAVARARGAAMVEALTAAATAARDHVAARDDGAAGFRARGAAPGVRWPAHVGVHPVTGSSASGPVTGPIPGRRPGPAPGAPGGPPAAARDDRGGTAASADLPDAPPDALGLAREVRAAGGTVVVAGGCFDVLHPGHVRLLGAARGLGDCLIVCLNGDLSVRRLKGRRRPVNPVEDRAEVLGALAPVDAVFVFDEDDPCAALEQLRPHLFVKGADHAGTDLPEREVLARWGGEIVFVPVVPGRSTTRVLEIAAGTAAS